MWMNNIFCLGGRIYNFFRNTKILIGFIEHFWNLVHSAKLGFELPFPKFIWHNLPKKIIIVSLFIELDVTLHYLIRRNLS
jgi:hypothetical protein